MKPYFVAIILLVSSVLFGDVNDEHKVDIETALTSVGDKVDVYFTIECDERQDTRLFNLGSSLLNPPVNISSVDDAIAYLAKELPQTVVIRDKKDRRIIHIIAASIIDEDAYAMNKKVSLAFNGTPTGLLESLTDRGIQKSDVVVGEVIRTDNVSRLSIHADNLDARTILSAFLPLEGYCRLMWIAELRQVKEAKHVVYVQFNGPLPVRKTEPEKGSLLR